MNYLNKSSHIHDRFLEVNLDQSSDAWLDWRKTGLGSSDAPSILGQSPWTTRRELWSEKHVGYYGSKSNLTREAFEKVMAGIRKREGSNDSAKNRGKKLEPVVREEYENFMGIICPPICGTHIDYPFLKVSFDGWNPTLGIFNEIKCPKQSSHFDALNDYVPDYYVPQILHQFLVGGLATCDYISYHDRMPPGQRTAIVRINEKTARATLRMDMSLAELVDGLFQAEKEFWDMVISGNYIPLEGEVDNG